MQVQFMRLFCCTTALLLLILSRAFCQGQPAQPTKPATVGSGSKPKAIEFYHADYFFYEGNPDKKKKPLTFHVQSGSRVKLRQSERYALSFSYGYHARSWQRRALGQLFGGPDSKKLRKYPMKPDEIKVSVPVGITVSMSTKDKKPTLAATFLVAITVSKDCKVGDHSIFITVPRGPNLGIGDNLWMKIAIPIKVE